MPLILTKQKARGAVNMEFENEDGLYDELLDEIDEDAGTAFARGVEQANNEMVEENWGEEY